MVRCFALLCISLVAVGCGQKSAPKHEASVQAKPVVFNTAKLPTVAFSVPDMMCPDGCGVKVKEILSEQPGAKEVVVDFDNKMATVAVEDTTKFDSNAALAALVDHAFKNSALKSGDATAPAAGASEPSQEAPSAKPKETGAG